MLARLILIPTGLVLGAAAALVFLPVAALFDPVTREAGAAIGSFGIMAALANATGAAEGEVAAFGAAIATGLAAICVVPLVLTALIGEVARVRSLVWYAGATGLISAAMPYILRAGLRTKSLAGDDANLAEQRFLLLFFLTGALAGFIYWAVAGRGGLREPMPRQRDLPPGGGWTKTNR
jgi:hypothetical protein